MDRKEIFLLSMSMLFLACFFCQNDISLASNQLPQAANISVSTSQGSSKLITLIGSDPEGNLLSYIIVSPPNPFQASLIPVSLRAPTDPNYIFNPAVGFVGRVTFTYKVNNRITDSNIATVTVTVTSALSTPTPIPSPNSNSTRPYRSIRSVTWYNFGASPQQDYTDLQTKLPLIKSAGFNTLWLVNPWVAYDPNPLATPHYYNEQAFIDLKKILDLLRANHIQAIIGLNYLGEGWSPAGINACPGWVEDPAAFNAFKAYTTEFLTRIQSYSDMVHILVFTENAEPCRYFNSSAPGYAGYYADGNHPVLARQVGDIMRNTLGNLPNQLPPDLRNRFSFGYHDYTLINWGLVDVAHMPVASPTTFNFLSMAHYGMDGMTNNQIASEIDLRIARFNTFYPNVPLIAGEFGAGHCPDSSASLANQSRVVTAIASKLLDKQIGFNVWGWLPLPNPTDECSSAAAGVALTNADDSWKPALTSLQSFLKPRANSGQVNTAWDPWAVSISGSNLSPFIEAQISDSTGRWGGNIPTTLAPDYAWLSFRLPSNRAPSGCNASGPCAVSVVLVDRLSGLASNSLSLTLPPASSLDTTQPTVSITTPVDGSTVSGSSVVVSANASDNVGVVGVQFKLDGINLGSEDTTTPYSVLWNTTTVSNGNHALTAIARDSAGNTATSSATVLAANAGEAFKPIGYLDGFDGSGNAIGWSLDMDTPSQSIDVHLYVDGPAGSGMFAGVAHTDQLRTDVNNAYHVTGNHGYSFSIPGQYRDGKTHKLYAYGIDSGGLDANNAPLATGDGLGYKSFTLGAVSSNCQASTPQEFKNCIAGISSGQINNIEVTTLMDCRSASDCSFVIDNINRPVSIYGTDPSKGFKRNGKFNYQLLSIVRSSQINIHDLKFEDDDATYCKPLDDANCAPLIYLGDDGQLTFNNISILNGKSRAMVASYTSRAPNITVSNSTFKNIGAHAIHTYNHFVGGKWKIIGNEFENIGSSAINLGITSPASDPSIVQGNKITHTHRDTLYHVCGPTATGRCTGGQLYIYDRDIGFPTANVIIKGNLFRDGYIDIPIEGDIYGVNGVEIDRYGVQNVSVLNNGFINSNGVIINYEAVNVALGPSSGIAIKNNVMNASIFQLINRDSYSGVIDLVNNVSGTEAEAYNMYLANKNSPAVATPVISPNGGSFTTAQTVTLTTSTAGASIHYTTDGSTPSSTDGALYGAAFTVSSSSTVKALAFKTGMTDSSVASAVFTITASNNPPKISDIPNQTTLVNTMTNRIAFTIGDQETPAQNLILTANSSNKTLLPISNIVLRGSGASRMVILRPAPNQTGTSTIALTVTDGGGLTARSTFTLTVTARTK